MTTAPAGTAVDQRTGQPMVIGSIPTPAQWNAQHKAQIEVEQRERDELMAYLEQTLAPQVTAGDGVVDVRKLNTLVQAEFARLTSLPEGSAGAVASFRRAAGAAKAPNAKAEKELAVQRKAAIEEAESLTAELDIRAAWLFRDLIQAAAVRMRYLEAGERLGALVRQHRLAVDVARFTVLAVRAQELAGQYEQLIAHNLDPDLWRRNLPQLEPLELPEALRATVASVADPATSQATRAPFDPNLPKDHAMRMAMATKPAERNADGTLVGSVRNPWGGNTAVPPPRSEAAEFATRKKIAAELAAEDSTQ
ncbi:MAG: hypothetical protein ACHQ0J_01290 [Candidatus Dormibacterales bacterium]